jgi:hypothetical protein
MIDGKCEVQTVLINPSISSVSTTQNGPSAVLISVQQNGSQTYSSPQLLATSPQLLAATPQLLTTTTQTISQPISQPISQLIIQPNTQANPNLTPGDCASILNAYWTGYKCVCKVGYRSSNGVCLPLNEILLVNGAPQINQIPSFVYVGQQSSLNPIFTPSIQTTNVSTTYPSPIVTANPTIIPSYPTIVTPTYPSYPTSTYPTIISQPPVVTPSYPSYPSYP